MNSFFGLSLQLPPLSDLIMFLLTVVIFVSILLNSNTRADHDEVITEEDLKAFEEALGDIRRQSSSRVHAEGATATDLNQRLSGRSKKLNGKALQQSFPRKRGRQRNHLRRLGIFLKRRSSNPKETNNRLLPLRKHIFNFRKRKRKPVNEKIIKKTVGETKKRKKSSSSRSRSSEERAARFLFRAEDRFSQENNLERTVIHVQREPVTTSTLPPPTTALNMLKITPPRHRGEIRLRATTRGPLETASLSESTSTIAALEALIAALENIEPREFNDELFADETTPFSTASLQTTTKTSTTAFTTSSTTSTSTTAIPTTSTTSEITTTTRKSRARGSSFKISTPAGGSGPTPPSIAAEARRLSLEIESNFIQEEASTGPEPPAPIGPQPPGSGSAPAHFPPGFAPPGAEPPSDFVVNELNEADDFLAVASKLQILRRKSSQLQ